MYIQLVLNDCRLSIGSTLMNSIWNMILLSTLFANAAIDNLVPLVQKKKHNTAAFLTVYYM